MAIELVTDRLLEISEAADLFGEPNTTRLTVLINALSAKARRFMNRVQLKANSTTAITEWVRSPDPHALWLRASPLVAGKAVTVEIYVEDEVDSTYTLANGDLRIIDSDRAARLELWEGAFPGPEASPALAAKVTYYAGWSPIPGDVIEGAVMQARIDLSRMEGEVGVTSRGRQGETTGYESEDIVQAVRELWSPYVVTP